MDEMSISTIDRSPSLKAHKAFPRRPRDTLPASDLSPSIRQVQTNTQRRKKSSSPLSQGRASSDGRHDNVSTRPPALPPTPPSNPTEADIDESSQNKSIPKRHRMDPMLAHDEGIRTPLNQRSPPTPDTTPPRDLFKTSSLRPPLPHRLPSSRTASFRTAQEEQSSSDEDLPRTPLAAANSGKGPRPSSKSTTQEVNFGPDLESRLGNLRSRGAVKGDVFSTFDGNWGQSEAKHAKRKNEAGNDNLPRNATVPCEKIHRSDKPSKDQPRDKSRDPDHTPSMGQGRSPSLRERIRYNRESIDRTSAEKFAEQYQWPIALDDFLLEAVAPEFDVSRFSRTSTKSDTSTIIEAFVVESPPQWRPALRHSRKHPALREQNASTRRSFSLPVKTDAISHHLARKSLERPEVHHKSLQQRASANISDSVKLQKKADVIPEVLTPQHSTSSESAQDPPHHQRLLSLTAPRLQSSTTPSSNDAGYFDLPTRKKRTKSDSVSSALRFEGTRNQDFTPVIPQRRSSLSAPTSRNGSRAASTRSASVHTRGSSKDRDIAQPKKSHQVFNDHSVIKTTQSRNDQMSGKYLSAPITSFSTLSNHSTPEALEVSKATAVNIYPHQNKSLLVVQQHSRPASQDCELPGAMQNGQMFEITSQTSPKVNLPSPDLRNPPQAPEFKIIPPTPHTMTPSEEVEHGPTKTGELSSTSGRNRTSGPFALVRRALSNRRYSDSFVPQFSRFRGVDEGTQTKSARRPVVGDGKDSQLSPFWRPRGFWDDLELDEDNVEEEFLERGRSELLEYAGPRPHRGRQPSYFVRPWDGYSYGDEGRRSGRRHFRRGDSRATSTRGHHRVHTVPGLGVQVEFVGWHSVQQRLREVRNARAERARDRQLSKIKNRISPPTPIEPSAI